MLLSSEYIVQILEGFKLYLIFYENNTEVSLYMIYDLEGIRVNQSYLFHPFQFDPNIFRFLDISIINLQYKFQIISNSFS